MERERNRPFAEEQQSMKQEDGFSGIGEIREEFFRSGGKGGQNVNKVETGVRLRARIEDPDLLQKIKARFPGYLTGEGELLIEATRERIRGQNRKRALARLEEIIAFAQEEPKERIVTKPKRSAKEQRLAQKRRRGEVKELRQKVREW